MKVSIAMTTFNGEDYLREQLDSFITQTRQPDELVVCDDGSSDRTMEILNRFARQAPFPLQVHCNVERLGYSKNFERSIEFCRGDVIFLSDQDDVWFPEKIEVVLRLFESSNRPLMVIHDAELTDAWLKPSGLTVIGQIRSAGLTTDSFVAGACTAFRAELLPLILPIPHEHFVYDLWIHRIGVALDRRVVCLQLLQYYRRHGRNVSQWFTNQTKRVTLLDLIKHYWLQDSREICVRRLVNLEKLANRLGERGVEVERLLGEGLGLNEALNGIRKEEEAVRQRLALLEKNKLCRLPAAWRILQRGSYKKFFSGWKSLIKDLVR